METRQEYSISPIGFVESPHQTPANAPIQPSGAAGVPGRARLLPPYVEAAADLEGFSHLVLIYWFHKSQGWQPRVTPFLDNQPRGLFATRAPKRPNPLGLSVVRLQGVEGEVLHLLDVDLVNGTPLLDIKPYIPEFDSHPEAVIGWMEGKSDAARQHRSDTRFTGPGGGGEGEPEKK